MKIIIENSPNMTNGWVNTLRSAKHSVYLWDTNTKSLYDIFDEVDPDLFIGSASQIKLKTQNLLKEFKYTKTALFYDFASNYKANVFFNYSVTPHPKAINLPKAIDTTIVGVSDVKGSEIVYVGQYKPWSGHYLFPLCNDKYDLRIFGYGQWPVSQHVGSIRQENIPGLYETSDICPDIQPESTSHISERVFTILGSGGICISNDKNVKKVFDIPIFNNKDEFLQLINERSELAEKHIGMKDMVLDRHTYYHRMHALFYALHLKDEADKFLRIHYETK